MEGVGRATLAQLKKRLEQGRSVDEVFIKRGLAEHDDRLVIQFGDHDPAISPFRVPRSRDLDV